MERFIRLLVRRDFVVWWGKARGCADKDEANKGALRDVSMALCNCRERKSKRTAWTVGRSGHGHLLLTHVRCGRKGVQSSLALRRPKLRTSKGFPYAHYGQVKWARRSGRVTSCSRYGKTTVRLGRSAELQRSCHKLASGEPGRGRMS